MRVRLWREGEVMCTEPTSTQQAAVPVKALLRGEGMVQAAGQAGVGAAGSSWVWIIQGDGRDNHLTLPPQLSQC